jgi:adenylate kinase family enzyme
MNDQNILEYLAQHMFFIHGPSGAGKGELQHIIRQQFEAEGYTVMQIASGDLFRMLAAEGNSNVGAKMRSGKYIETLYGISPAIERVFTRFVQEYIAKKGKVIIMWDGVIRRDAQEGEYSQIAQLNRMFRDAAVRMHIDDDLPYDLVHRAKHVLIDIPPEDAEAQIRSRASKELVKLKKEIYSRILDGNERSRESMYLWRLYGILEPLQGLVSEHIDSNAALFYEQQATILRIDAARSLRFNDPEHTTFKQIFAAAGIKTELRDDDIAFFGRLHRVENYMVPVEGGYRPGYAAQALIDGLGYEYAPDGHMYNQYWNEDRLVIRNGAHNGIGFKQFQQEGAFVAKHLYNQVEGERMAEGQEGALRL